MVVIYVIFFCWYYIVYMGELFYYGMGMRGFKEKYRMKFEIDFDVYVYVVKF